MRWQEGHAPQAPSWKSPQGHPPLQGAPCRPLATPFILEEGHSCCWLGLNSGLCAMQGALSRGRGESRGPLFPLTVGQARSATHRQDTA